MARPATVEEVAELVRSAWAIVQDADLPEGVQSEVLGEVIRILADDRHRRPPPQPSPLDY